MNDALEYIHSVSWRGSRLGLERTSELLERMGRPQDELRFLHIAGTNGKGSTAAMCDSMLRAAGYNVGLYTSPYLYSFNERMRINGSPIGDDELCELTGYVRQYAEAMDDHPTEFELVTAIALEYFRRGGCDIVVLEVGLGGRLDSTNAVDNTEVAAITAIGYDHTRELGNTLELIAAEKAGIIKPGCDVAAYSQAKSIMDVFRNVARERGAQFTEADFGALNPICHSLNGQRFDFGSYKALELPLLGAYQLGNAALAVTAVQRLNARGWNVPESAVREGLRAVSWPGRFELLHRRPYFVVDGGHNPQCAEAMAKNLRDYFPDRKALFLTGVMADKDYAAMFDSVAPLAKGFIAVTPDNARALPAAELASFLRRYGLPVSEAGSVEEGVASALAQSGPQDCAVAFGSLYMAGAVRACFGRY